MVLGPVLVSTQEQRLLYACMIVTAACTTRSRAVAHEGSCIIAGCVEHASTRLPTGSGDVPHVQHDTSNKGQRVHQSDGVEYVFN